MVFIVLYLILHFATGSAYHRVHKIDTYGYLYFGYLSPAFSKKSGGTLFLVFRGAWCVARGAWRVVPSF